MVHPTYFIAPGAGIGSLRLEHADLPELQVHEVRVKVGAVSLNYRDLMIALGDYGPLEGVTVPCSDAAGEVIAVGSSVSRFRPGDRVITNFFPHWIDGDPTPAKTRAAPGGSADGVLRTLVQRHEDSLTAAPARMSFVEACTLPCAGVTAWNALFELGRLSLGHSVLIQGTGGVSTWALQLARAAGVRPIVVSSSEERLARARELGASATANYKKREDWVDLVLEQTGGLGADLVVDVGGADTLPHSLRACRVGGTVAVVGGVSGFTTSIGVVDLVAGAKRMAGVLVGSRSMTERLVRAVESSAIRPVVNRIFAFDDAHQAFQWLGMGRHQGKVVIEVGPS
jgi:NADPH:quinone reductase-like Zn-dependent oxidoreductase